MPGVVQIADEIISTQFLVPTEKVLYCQHSMSFSVSKTNNWSETKTSFLISGKYSKKCWPT